MTKYDTSAGVDAKLAQRDTKISQNTALTSGYVAQTITGATTIAVAAGTYALSLSGNATLTLTASNGTAVSLDVITNGYTLTVAGGPTITADTFVTVSMSRGVWRGWSAITGVPSSSTTTTTTAAPQQTTTTSTTQQQATTTTTTAAASYSSAIDFTKATAGAAVAGMKLSGGETLSSSSSSSAAVIASAPGTYGAAVVSPASTGANVSDTITFGKSLARIRITADYAFSAANQNSWITPTIYAGPGGVGGANIGVRVKSQGGLADVSNSNFTYTFTPASPLPSTPLSGTLVMEWDAAAKTGRVLINGNVMCSFAGSSSNFTNPVAGAGFELAAWDSSTTGLKNIKVESY